MIRRVTQWPLHHLSSWTHTDLKKSEKQQKCLEAALRRLQTDHQSASIDLLLDMTSNKNISTAYDISNPIGFWFSIIVSSHYKLIKIECNNLSYNHHQIDNLSSDLSLPKNDWTDNLSCISRHLAFSRKWRFGLQNSS